MEELFQAVEVLANFAGLIGATISTGIWLQLRAMKKRAAQPISVKLVGDRRILELPLYLTRENLSRAEILGRLGMIPMKEKGKRFSLVGLSSPDFLRRINDAKSGKRGMILIPATEEEIDQFDL